MPEPDDRYEDNDEYEKRRADWFEKQLSATENINNSCEEQRLLLEEISWKLDDITGKIEKAVWTVESALIGIGVILIFIFFLSYLIWGPK